jgi:NTP pyrophosphatase (non-canonical NTP hydrolase)
MSKFKVGDKVVAIPDGDVDRYYKDRVFYIVSAVDDQDGLVSVLDDEGQMVEWFDWRFKLFDGEEPSEPEIPPTVQHFIPLIEQWGRDRGILDNSTPLGQSRKTVEEVRELVEAATMYSCYTISRGAGETGEDYRKEALDDIADAIGDIFVTLVMVAGCAKLDINACVAQAYSAIKDRKGYLRPDGVFVKEEQV